MSDNTQEMQWDSQERQLPNLFVRIYEHQVKLYFLSRIKLMLLKPGKSFWNHPIVGFVNMRVVFAYALRKWSKLRRVNEKRKQYGKEASLTKKLQEEYNKKKLKWKNAKQLDG